MLFSEWLNSFCKMRVFRKEMYFCSQVEEYRRWEVDGEVNTFWMMVVIS